MMESMKRREFITLLGGAAAAWPLAARAQQRSMQVIGLLNVQSSPVTTNYLAAFHQGLAEAGFTEGRNLAIVYRSAEGIIERLPALAAELVSLQVAAIAAVGGDSSVLSAKAATATIPIVFTTGGDPVEIGIVASLNRPGGNVTGVTVLGSVLVPKQIGLLRDMVPRLATIGLLLNPTNPVTPSVLREIQAAVQLVGLKMVVVEGSTEGEVDTAFARLVEQRVDALVIAAAADFNRRRDFLIALAARHAIPAVFTNRDFAADGGMMSYAADFREAYRQAGNYVARILKGDKPSDLPVMQPTRFELVINLKTARALGLTVPPGLLAIADEVIE
jgi:putative tryptophan/tyrosine transport system substrate-binding protein